MSNQMLRYAILILGLISGVIHAIVLPVMGYTWLLMPLNGLGFFVLTGVYFFNPAFLSGQRKLIKNLFIAYTLVTIAGFFAVNSAPYKLEGFLSIITEVLLVNNLWLYKDK